MKVLKSVIKLFFYCGTSFIPQPYKWYKYFEKCCILCVSLLWIGLIHRMIANMNDISQVLLDLPNFVGLSVACISFIFYTVNKLKFFELYNNIKMMVEKEKTDGEIEMYRAVELRIRKYVKIVTIPIFVSVGFYVVFPIMQMCYKSLQGTYDISQRQLPTTINAFYDLTKSPAYEFTYLINVLAIMVAASFLAAKDTMYMGISLYVVTGYKVLQIKIKNIDTLDSSTETDNKVIRKPVTQNIINHKIQERMKKIIQLHCALISYHELYQQVYSEMIFTTIGCLLITISGTLFQMSSLSLNNFGNTPAFIPSTLSCYLMIFLQCYFGHLVTIEGENIADAAYNSLWYLRTPRERKYLLMIIQISQRTRYISGFNYYKCTMETFANVCKATFSIIAIMQNIDRK